MCNIFPNWILIKNSGSILLHPCSIYWLRLFQCNAPLFHWAQQRITAFRTIPLSPCLAKVLSLWLFQLTLCLHLNTVITYMPNGAYSVDALHRTGYPILFLFVVRSLIVLINPILHNITTVSSVNSQRVLPAHFLPFPPLVHRLLHLSSIVSRPLSTFHLWVPISLLSTQYTLRQNQSSYRHVWWMVCDSVHGQRQHHSRSQLSSFRNL